MAHKASYTEEDIEVLEGLEAVRTRPGMYIGGLDVRGYHHLLWEIMDNAIDEAINGHASVLKITLHADGRSATVEDNGRGIPVGIMPKYNKSALEIIFTTLHSGGKFKAGNYTHSGGLHGVGSSVVNALSEELVVRIRREGQEVQQRYAKGIPTTQVFVLGPSKAHGTTVFFRPDVGLFGPNIAFDSDLIRERIEIKSYLHKGLKLIWVDETHKTKTEFAHQHGIEDYLQKWLQEQQKIQLHTPFYVHKDTDDGLRIELALGWTEATDERIRSYVNGIPTPQGGSHESGLRSGINKAVRHYLDIHQRIPKGISVAAEDVREGLFAILSCYVVNPQFQGQTKERLNNPEVAPQTESVVRTFLEGWLHQNPTTADAIATRVVQAARAREAAKAASQAVSRKMPGHTRLMLPGKLSDCSSNKPQDCELFIVEGDSAGGSAKQGRDRRTQAILPLRGKVLNTEQASTNKLLSNKELQDVIAALGCGFGPQFDRAKLRYHRIFLLMDADSDGYHISTLLLTFFYRHLPELIHHGHVYLAQPPLYRINIGKEIHWVLDDPAKDKLLSKLPKTAKPDIQRFKGLGEMMPDQLWATTLDPARRTALKVCVPHPEATDRLMSELMGRDASARFRLISEHAKEMKELDV